MMYGLPIEVTVRETVYHITNRCDYRVVLDVIEALKDDTLDQEEQTAVALIIFYEELTRTNIRHCPHLKELVEEMSMIINCGERDDGVSNIPVLMDWEHDFNLIAPPVSRVLGYSVRDSKNYTHWWDFVGAYMEIGDCTFANVVSIRCKKARGKKLDNSDLEFYRKHRQWVDLPRRLTKEEQELLNSEW